MFCTKIRYDVLLETPVLSMPWLTTNKILIDSNDQPIQIQQVDQIISKICVVETIIIERMYMKDVLFLLNNDLPDQGCHRRWTFGQDKNSPWLFSVEIVGVLTLAPTCNTNSLVPVQHINIKTPLTEWDYDLAMVVILRNQDPDDKNLWHANGRLADLSVAIRSLLRFSTSCMFRLHLVIQSENHAVIFRRLFSHSDFEKLHVVLYIMTDEMSLNLLTSELMQFTNPRLQDALKKVVLPAILPSDVFEVLVLDTDIVIVDDICPTFLIEKKTMFGFASDHPVNLSPPDSVTAHLLSPGLLHPRLPISFTGVNSGVITWRLDKTRLTDYEYVWKHALATFIYEYYTATLLVRTRSILESFLHLGDQGIFNQIVRQHKEWLTVLPLGMNFQLHTLTRFRYDYLCEIPMDNLHLKILHGTANVFKHYGWLLGELVWKPFLRQEQFAGADPSVLGDAHGIDLAYLTHVFLYHNACIRWI